MADILFSKYKLRNLELGNRVVMAPMTRARSEQNIPGDIVAKYYGQRSEAGLIITEGTAPSPNGLGYARIPGIFNEAQRNAWKKTTDVVHSNGSRIFVQLMHTGRVSHPLNQPKGARVLAPSAVATPDEMFTEERGLLPCPVPDAMTEEDIERTMGEYEHAARLAIEAGFDGVELHGANGYLIDQFLNRASNQRSDEWGGTIAGRTRFAVEVAKRVGNSIGFEKVGMRVSPYGVFNGMTPDPEHDELYADLVAKLDALGLAYIHIVDHSSMGAPPVKDEIKQMIRERFSGTVILSGGYDRERAEHDLAEKRGDLVAFGRPFVSNPNLVSRLKAKTPLTDTDFSTLYTPGEKGYTDYV